jgi:hypothetical protein
VEVRRERHPRRDGRVRRVVGVHVFVGQRGVQCCENPTGVAFVRRSGANARNKRSARPTRNAEGVEIALHDVNARVA